MPHGPDATSSPGGWVARVASARAALHGAGLVVLGGGAGLSAAAGLEYSGRRFTENFAPFVERYGMTDMYTSGFHPFATDEERWAYWAQHVGVNRFDPPGLPLYRQLLDLVRDVEHFVVTTNVDHQFVKSGFAPGRVFAVQGDYGLMQCARACHRTLYDDEVPVRGMRAATRDCRVPAHLVPRCPVCGGPMDVNLRKDHRFVQDDAWHRAAGRYRAFMEQARGRRTVLLELGVGFNTPGIIRYPFERLAAADPLVTHVRLNRDDPGGPGPVPPGTVVFTEDMAQVVAALGRA